MTELGQYGLLNTVESVELWSYIGLGEGVLNTAVAESVELWFYIGLGEGVLECCATCSRMIDYFV